MSDYRAVIFDMDGLMLDTERVDHAACRRAAAFTGVPFDDALYVRTIGRTAVDTRLLFLAHYGERFPYESFRDRWRQCREEIVAAEGVALKPGLTELIGRLQQTGLRLAVATSTVRARATRLLRDAGVLPHFNVVVCGDDVTRGKPAPDLFLKAAGELGVSPAECIVLEDSEPGARAAHAAGMRVILVPDLQPPSAEVTALCFAVCRTLHEVQRFL